MANFEFTAKAQDGKFVKGELSAANETEARVRIRAQKLIPLKVVVKGSAESAPKVSFLASMNDTVKTKDLQIFTRQFAVLISAGVPIVQSIDAMSRGARSPGLTKTLQKVTSDVEKGRRLADALALHPKVFDRLYVNLVRAGEESGALDLILNRLAEYIEKSVKLRNKIKSALWYPAAIIVVAIGVVSAIMIFVVPKLASMFTSSGHELPALTQFVINCSNFFQHYWYIVVAALVGIPMGLKMYYETEDGRKVIDQILIETPVFGGLIQKGAIARFSRTLGTLLSSGVRIMDSLEIASTTAGNWVLEKALSDSRTSVSKGRALVEPLEKIKYIPKMVCQMIAIGEQTGNMDQMLSKIADFYEDEVENATEAMTSLIEPMLMVVLGGIIAVIVIAMYLPIFNLAGAVTGG